jgi:hypothetical protein
MPLYRQSFSIFQAEYLEKKKEIKMQNITLNLETKRTSKERSSTPYEHFSARMCFS